MTNFTVSLIGIPISISAIYPTTETYMKEYLCNEEPWFHIAISDDDILYEQKQSIQQDERHNVVPHSYSDKYLETLAVLRKISKRLPEYGAILFHGSAVAVDGCAYLFTAPSGVGKTTHSQLWLNQLPQAFILNGDKPFLKVTDTEVLVGGTPWRGKEKYGRNEILPLKSICLLERDSNNYIERIAFKDVLPYLLRQVYLPEESIHRTLEILEKIAKQTELYRLRCNAEAEAARVSIQGILGAYS